MYPEIGIKRLVALGRKCLTSVPQPKSKLQSSVSKKNLTVHGRMAVIPSDVDTSKLYTSKSLAQAQSESRTSEDFGKHIHKYKR